MIRHLTYAGLASAAAAGAAHAAGPEGYGGGYYGHPMMWGEGPGIVGVGMMMIFWILVIGLAIVAGRWLWESKGLQRKTPALDILKERLARGEIDPEDYEARRKALED